MWWEPRSEPEARLADVGRYLLEVYQHELQSEFSPLRGVGIGAATDLQRNGPPLTAEWRPLVLVDERTIGVTNRSGRFSWELLDPGSEAFDTVRRLDPPYDCLVEPVGPLVPAVAPGGPLASPAGSATVGLPVSIPSMDTPQRAAVGFLTVGHGVTMPGAKVSVGTRASGWATGEVMYQEVSAADPARHQRGGDDIALVMLDWPATLAGSLVHSGLATPPPGPPYPVQAVDLYGAKSPFVLAQVNAALDQFGDSTWQWSDCWELGGTTPPMVHGDSGALAIGPQPDNVIFGHFVGGSVALRGTGFTHHWVQDLASLQSRVPWLDQVVF